jgi:hypothetical protein
MTSWQTFTITEIEKGSLRSARLVFHLDRTFDNGDKSISTHYGEPHDTWRVGDIIEVDVDNYKKRYIYNSREYEAYYVTESDNVVRKFSSVASSSAVIPAPSSSSAVVSTSSAGILPPAAVQQVSAIAQSLAQEVDRSGGRHEFEYKIEIRHPDGSSASHSLIARPSKYYQN